jgi:hypothetical protein
MGREGEHPMNSREILAEQLEATAKTVQWAISLVPEARLMVESPHGEHPRSDRGFRTYFGKWPAYRHLFHLVHYEGSYALPTMKHWLGAPPPKGDLMFPDMDQEEMLWEREKEKGPNLGALQQRFRSLRKAQIEVTRSIPVEAWCQEKVSTGLGKVSAELVVTKTIEHTLVHGKTILRNALYWDRALEWLDSQN